MMANKTTMAERVEAYLVERSTLGFSITGPTQDCCGPLPASRTDRVAAR
jgi:hypothetical protein